MQNIFILLSIVLTSVACRDIEPEEERPLESSSGETTEDFGCGPGCDDCRIWLFGGEGSGNVATSKVMSFDGTSWTNEGDIPAARAYSGIVVRSGKVWLFGGSNTNSLYTSSDLTSWESAGTLPVSISPFYNVSFFADQFWITGGGVGEGAANIAFSSSDGASWGLGSNMPSLSRHAAEVFEGYLRLFGGYTGTNTVSSVFTSSSLGTMWTQSMGGLPGNLSEMAKIRWNGTILLAGGDTGSEIQTSVISYDSPRNTWDKVGDLPAPRYRGSMIGYKDKIWFIGGLDASAAPSDAIWSSPDGVTWTEETKLAEPLSGAAVALFSKTCGTGAPL